VVADGGIECRTAKSVDADLRDWWKPSKDDLVYDFFRRLTNITSELARW